MNRRSFFKNVAGLCGVALAAPVLLSSYSSNAFAEGGRRKKAGDGPEMVDMNDPVAKGVQYVEDAKKNPKANGNKCATCALYQKKQMVEGKEVGGCAIFGSKNVVGNGFCNSWVKKA